jgi:hypothetical protein
MSQFQSSEWKRMELQEEEKNLLYKTVEITTKLFVHTSKAVFSDTIIKFSAAAF